MKAWTYVLPFLALLGASVSASAESLRLRFIGQQRVATDTQIDGTTLGGLSGIDYDWASNRYIAISDDRSRYGPARFYAISLDLSARDFSAVHFVGTQSMRQPDGNAYPSRTIDAESIRFSGQHLLYASEGDTKRGVAPFTREMANDGRYIRGFEIPAHYMPVPGRRTSGIRNNLAFESLTLSGDGMHVLAATENALEQDGPAASLRSGSRARILSFDRASGQPNAEYVYEVDPVVAGTARGGLSELLAIGGTQYLALERSYAPGAVKSVKIFLIDLAGATDVLDRDALGDAYFRPVTKRLLFDVGALGIKLENIEGMTFGQPLENGHRSLILVSDNNFSKAETTQFLAFDVERIDQPLGPDIIVAAADVRGRAP
jgi:hypothetical protein